MGIQLVLPSMSPRSDNTNSVIARAFGVLIVALVVVRSLLMMADLNDNMMPSAELMNRQTQH
jgi:cytochrome o ubiquinol oxidase operon protein cyoD